MISRRFSKVSDKEIIDFLNDGYARTDEDGLFETVESISDLWMLANMKLSNLEIEEGSWTKKLRPTRIRVK